MKARTATGCVALGAFIALLLCKTYETKRIRYNWIGMHHPYEPAVSLQSPCNLFTAHDTANFTTIFQQFKNDTPLYYSYITMIDGFLYVGAMNYLFKFNSLNISKPVKTLYGPPRTAPVENCKRWMSMHPNKAHCENHFLYVTLNKTAAAIYNRSRTFYICVSMSHDPEGWIVDADTFELLDRNYSNLIRFICPYNPFSNSSYLHVENGNPGNKEAIYWASTIDRHNTVPIISRTELLNPDKSIVAYRTITANMQNDYYFTDAHFVKMFDMGKFVYTFFRNTRHPMEILNDVMRSYVGRMCKSDRGDHYYKGVWTSYGQVQLQCKLPYTIYSYDNIQDVVEVGDEFYAIFTSLSSDWPGSVMCRYSKARLEELFKSRTYITRNGKKTVTTKIYDCDHGNDTRTYQINRVILSREYYVIYGECIPVLQSFIMFLPDVFLRELEVDNNTISDSLVLYAGSNTGEIYQIYYLDREDYEVYISAVFKPNHVREPVTDMLFNSETRMLFVGYRSALVQLAIPDDLCYLYKLADGCMYNPTCLWNVTERRCIKNVTSLKLNETDTLLSYKNLSFLWPDHRVAIKISKYVYEYETVNETWTRMLKLESKPTRQINVTSGSSHNFQLDLATMLCHSGSLRWYHDNEEITYHPDSDYLIDKKSMLTLKHTNATSGGLYTAVDELGLEFTRVNVTVTPVEDPKARWLEKFNEWCDEFEKYKEKIKNLTCEPKPTVKGEN